MTVPALPAVGAVCVVTRRDFMGRVDHRWESAIVRLTPKRAYFEDGSWFATDDPVRTVKPQYLDYATLVDEIRAPEKRSASR